MAAGASEVNLVRGDMAALPFASGSIAIVFCRSALHHVDDEASPVWTRSPACSRQTGA